MSLKEKWLQFVNNMNQFGIPIPLIRSPNTGLGSVSLTLVFISFNLVIVGLIGRYSKLLEGVDVTQALYLFQTSAALYFGRRLQSDGKGKIDIAEETKPKDP